MSSLESTLEKVGRVLSDKYGIRVVCGGERCCTDGRVIHLPSLPDNLPEDLSRTIHALVDHESSHLLFQSDFKVGAAFKRQHGDAAFAVLNCLEDLRVEQRMVDTFPGTSSNFAHGYRYAYSVAEQAVAKGEALPVMKQVAIAICTRGMGTPDWPMVPADVYGRVAPLTPLLRQARTAKSTKAMVPLAEKVWKELRPLFAADTATPPPTPAPKKPSGAGESLAQGGARSRGGQDTSAQDQNPNRDNIEMPAHGDATAQPDSGRDAASQPGKPGQAQKAAGQDHADTVNMDGADARGLLGGLGDELSRRIADHAQASNAYRVWNAEGDVVRVAADSSALSHHERMRPVLRHVGGVRQRLLQTLQADVRARWRPDVETGALNPRALYRLAVTRHPGDEPRAVDTARRVFRERVVTKRLRTAVTLLVDQSQSMRGPKIALARETALVFCEALSRLSIPTSVVGFSTGENRRAKQYAGEAGCSVQDLSDRFRVEPLVLEIFKDFAEKFERVSGRFDGMNVHRLTPLGESMLFAARRLATRPEERKVLFVLTDGRPAVGMGDESVTFKHAQDSLRRIEKAGIDVALVGIQDETVRSLHPRSVVVYRLDDLPRTILAQLQRLLTAANRSA